MERMINGKEYHNVGCAARELGVKEQSLRDYMKNHKCSCEDAYNHFRDKKIIINGYTFFNINAVARALGVNKNTFRSYVRRYGDVTRACAYYQKKGHELMTPQKGAANAG